MQIIHEWSFVNQAASSKLRHGVIFRCPFDTIWKYKSYIQWSKQSNIVHGDSLRHHLHITSLQQPIRAYTFIAYPVYL